MQGTVLKAKFGKSEADFPEVMSQNVLGISHNFSRIATHLWVKSVTNFLSHRFVFTPGITPVQKVQRITESIAKCIIIHFISTVNLSTR